MRRPKHSTDVIRVFKSDKVKGKDKEKEENRKKVDIKSRKTDNSAKKIR